MSKPVETPALRRALERAVELGERSVQVAAYLGDELIVDSRIGDPRPDRVFPIFSVSKAITALAVHVQAERGLIDLDAPIARYWPEYAAHGKDGITVRHVLTHRGGVPQMPAGTTPDDLDWDRMVARLAALEPMFAPGTTNAYHSISFGWILGEVVRRTDPKGRSFADFVQEELCRPLGADSFWFGIPDEVAPRVATLDFPDEPPPTGPDELVSLAVPPAIALVPSVFNRPDVQRTAIPAVGGIGDARSVARLFAVLANGGTVGGVRLLSPDRILALLQPYAGMGQEDLVYKTMCPIGVGGLWLFVPGLGPDNGFGRVLSHMGAGGSVGFADPASGLAGAICHDRMFGAPKDYPFADVWPAVLEIAAAHR